MQKLQILEVERRLALLRGRVLGREEVEQLLQEILVARGELVERGLLEPVAGRRGTLRPGRPPRAGRARSSSCSGFGPSASAACAAASCLSVHVGVGGERARRLPAARRAARRRAPARPSSSVSVAAGRAQRLVDAGEHPAQALRAVGREQPQALRVARRAERRERALERLAADHGAVLVVELAEARVDADRERVRAQEARAEAVDRRDPRAVEPAREVGPAARRAARRGCARATHRRPCACR